MKARKPHTQNPARDISAGRVHSDSLGVVGVILLTSVILSLAWKPAPKAAPETKS